MQLLHPSLGRPLGRFPVDLASRTCLTSLLGEFRIEGRTNMVVIFQFSDRRSTLRALRISQLRTLLRSVTPGA